MNQVSGYDRSSNGANKTEEVQIIVHCTDIEDSYSNMRRLQVTHNNECELESAIGEESPVMRKHWNVQWTEL